MQQEVLLAMLAKEPSPGYQLRARLDRALGRLGEAMNAGHIYVQLGRLEKAGLIARREATGASDGPDRRVYELTPAGQERVIEWLGEVSWPKPRAISACMLWPPSSMPDRAIPVAHCPAPTCWPASMARK